mgnify:CR=1 FL=1
MSRHDGKVWVRKLRTGYSTHPWEVRARNHNGYDYYETFYSWREALVEADRLARTREVVLPRLRPHGELTVSAIWSFDSLVVHYTDASGQIAQGTPADLARHAATLLALAEQEGTA